MTQQPSRVMSIVLALIAIPLALITLIGLEPLPILPEPLRAGAGTLSQLLVQGITVVAALAVIVGVANLLHVQFGKLRSFPTGIYSLITVLTFFAVIVIHVLERLAILKPPAGTEGTIYTLTLMDILQVAIESALAGVLAFFLIYAAYRLMRRRVTLWGVLFTVTLLIVLLGYVPLTGLDFLHALREWILRVPVAAGTRGLLIGVAIGTLTVGIRVILGQDRSLRG
ncbi:MAG TPA: hypothetical protein VMT34_11335 [Aggregatilineales bacterium]|nr:hypothetical protein [Aggregatilineales bacterium]